jgi:hypothetical protein
MPQSAARSAKCFICAPQTVPSRGGIVGTAFLVMDFTMEASIHSKGGFSSLVFLAGPARRNQCNETCVRLFSPA